MSIKGNLKDITDKIEHSAIKSGRKAADIQLIGVTKTIDTQRMRLLWEEGVKDFGENRVQELAQKKPFLPDDVRWHLIGHLQTNKVKYIVPFIHLIHSVDSLRLAQEIDLQAQKAGRVVDCLMEVNVAEEASKFGIRPQNVEQIAGEIVKLPNIKLSGLMTVAPYVENAEDNRVFFRKMRQLLIDIQGNFHNNIDMRYLSMGMTNDYPVAIEEGSNMVRIGTGLFGERP